MRKCTEIYERKGKLLLQASSRTPNGGWAGVGDCIVLKVGSAPENVGEAIRTHLAASGTLAPKPQGDIEPILSAAGVSSWARFARGTKLVSVAAEGGEITVTPSDWNGRSHRPANADAIRIPVDSDAKTLGETVLRALANSS
jgi:hypothetical protein